MEFYNILPVISVFHDSVPPFPYLLLSKSHVSKASSNSLLLVKSFLPFPARHSKFCFLFSHGTLFNAFYGIQVCTFILNNSACNRYRQKTLQILDYKQPQDRDISISLCPILPCFILGFRLSAEKRLSKF